MNQKAVLGVLTPPLIAPAAVGAPAAAVPAPALLVLHLPPIHLRLPHLPGLAQRMIVPNIKVFGA